MQITLSTPHNVSTNNSNVKGKELTRSSGADAEKHLVYIVSNLVFLESHSFHRKEKMTLGNLYVASESLTVNWLVVEIRRIRINIIY